MSYVNKVILIGNLGQDPKITATKTGGKMCQLSLATMDSYKCKKTNQWIKRTEWHKIVVYNSAFTALIEKCFKKGMKVYVEGTIQTRKWTDKSGMENSITEVVVPMFSGCITMIKDDDKPKDQNSLYNGLDLLDDEVPF